ncbi:MAG: hypoxanthine phosphoribosyltransferase [Bacillati bacterium ANGP1]|uniref:Hypoxanthine phosphoribosyltransferase n=1 Tax=Candidatus Segetimicrobium genomatis TaxID=2569760 RepID=A0A537JUP4_9BACT|nr:MAG: hypoxanthine phosphoribosyltransferase [Terrabacteria group bacterium ANGP1]
MTGPAEDIEEILLTQEQIAARVAGLARDISRDYAGRFPLLISVLKGAVYFITDLSRAITIPIAMDFMAITSYGSAPAQSGAVRLIKDLDIEITGRDVLLVEDIIDTGLTAGYLLRLLQARTPASLQICTLLDRPRRRILESLPIAYRGFEVPDRFLVGYGLDYREQYRNLPFIGVLKDSVLQAAGQPAG